MTLERACKACHTITTGEECPACKSTDLSKDFLGYVIVIDAKRSQIAKKMGIDTPGKYALKVR